ncbi:uncharacterized protein LOC143363178 isoform X2 [Halictus rubicundus]|uniref:uncharacterized protein LOC143363178 isoform X2 n=1 Tax=Halictus rubicundus TaxID=77578 RepID=UPI0040360B7C
MWFNRETSSIFYVDADIKSTDLAENDKMETEVRTLKQELVRTQEALKAATKRCRDLVKELDNRTAGHESEKSLRDQQLSRILRALLVLEARLKQEQKSIRQLLCEKDNVIRNQQLEIARLRRYTKNYIKCKREQTLGKASIKMETTNAIDECHLQSSNVEADLRQDNSISKDIQTLKCEIITKLNPSEVPVTLEGLDRGVKKTHSFAGSDISKTSLTSSENTDVSIITTTTEGSPSLLSTEGFCEGESTDVSPGSTLNKSSRCTPTMVTDSENEITMIFDDDNDDEDTMIVEKTAKLPKKKIGISRLKPQKASKEIEVIEATNIARTESKDDGMDCNFASEDEENEQEPIYVNACNETNTRNQEQTETVVAEVPKTNEDYSSNNSDNDDGGNNNATENSIAQKMEIEEQNTEETSGNWYSDPDEDRINDDVFRHSTYRPNSNHNSVLECVNQILLRDMEEEESILSVPRRFKHRGRIVRFQPARLSDIESVGSEMERKNSEEPNMEQVPATEFHDVPANSFEPSATEDEFGMSLTQTVPTNITTNISSHESSLEEESEESKAIPIVIIEPKVEVEEARNTFPCSQAQKTKAVGTTSPPMKLEMIEEKTCLQISSKGLTIAKNLDYEDIESLPEIISPAPKTPPALPPKPQFKNNTLILKKIPSPSFLIDETRKKQPLLESGSSEHSKKIFGFISSPLKSAGINVTSARSLNFDDAINKVAGTNEEGNFWKNRFNNVRSSFQTRQNSLETNGEQQARKVPRVTNMVRHFEEFKIGGESEEQTKERNKTKEKHVHSEFDQEFDIRQNFEEFNLDECNLSDDPDRPEGDGSERLNNLGATVSQNEKTATTKDNNNVPVTTTTNLSSGYDHFLEATGLSNKSILTPSRLLSNHKSMLKPKDVKYKNKIKATAVLEKHGVSSTNNTTHVRHWTGPFV